jgi:hypothetical protein
MAIPIVHVARVRWLGMRGARVLQLSARASLFSRTGRYTDLRQRREGPREQRQLLSQQDAPRFRPSPPLVLLGVDEVVDVVEVEVAVSDGDWVVDDYAVRSQ